MQIVLEDPTFGIQLAHPVQFNEVKRRLGFSHEFNVLDVSLSPLGAKKIILSLQPVDMSTHIAFRTASFRLGLEQVLSHILRRGYTHTVTLSVLDDCVQDFRL